MLYSKCIEFADALAASGKSAKEINESLKSFVGDDVITKDDGTVCEIPVIEEKEKSEMFRNKKRLFRLFRLHRIVKWLSR